MIESVKDLAIRALYNRAESDLHKSLASFKLLLDHPVGIGDHSTADYHNNLAEALDQLVDAEDRLSVIHKYFSDSVPVQE